MLSKNVRTSDGMIYELAELEREPHVDVIAVNGEGTRLLANWHTAVDVEFLETR